MKKQRLGREIFSSKKLFCESIKPVDNDNEQNEEVEVEELAAGKEADHLHQFRISPGESRHEIC